MIFKKIKYMLKFLMLKIIIKYRSLIRKFNKIILIKNYYLSNLKTLNVNQRYLKPCVVKI